MAPCYLVRRHDTWNPSLSIGDTSSHAACSSHADVRSPECIGDFKIPPPANRLEHNYPLRQVSSLGCPRHESWRWADQLLRDDPWEKISPPSTMKWVIGLKVLSPSSLLVVKWANVYLYCRGFPFLCYILGWGPVKWAIIWDMIYTKICMYISVT